MNLESIITKKFGEKFSYLKLLEVVYNTDLNSCTISFLYPEKDCSFSKDDKLALTTYLTDELSLNAKLVVKFQKSYLDQSLIQNAVLGYFKKFRASLASVLTLDNISVSVSEFGVEVTIAFPEKVLESLAIDNLEIDLKKFLNSKFIAEFFCKFCPRENLNFAEIDEKIKASLLARAKAVKPISRYKVFDVFKLIGNEITPEPEYMSNIRGSKSSVILAGRIQNFAKKTYKRMRKEVEVEKTYYKFTLHEDNRYIQMVYFCPKNNITKMDKLVDGTDVLVIADIKKENNNFSGYIRSLSLCQINEVVRKHSKEKINKYSIVHPQKYEVFSQGNIFDETKKFDSNISNNTFVVFDVETTGLDAETCEIIEIGAVKVSGGRIIEKFQTLVKPKKPISILITDITGITNEMVANAPTIEGVIKDFYLFTKNTILAGYNVGFDIKFIQTAGREFGIKFQNEVQDVMVLARQKVQCKNYKLLTVVKALNLTLDNAHRAFFDALATAEVLLELSKAN